MAEIVKQSYEIWNLPDYSQALKHIERAGRVCYQSGELANETSAERFVSKLIERGHESVLEHVSFTVSFITSRAIANQLVRHRLASFSQESTRYCNYRKKDMVFIKSAAMREYDAYAIENRYLNLLDCGESPETARDILPLTLKTEIVVTMNLRMWRHVLKERTQKAADPRMRELMQPLLGELKEKLGVLFRDI